MARTTKPARSAAGSEPKARVLAPSLPSAPPVAGPTPPPIEFAPRAPDPALPVPSLPRWKRASDSRMRKKVARILVLKLAGKKTAEIAKKMDTTPDTIRHYLYIAGKNGWLSNDGLELVDPAEQLVFESANKVVRNINHALDGKILGSQQFEMTVEAAKGTGLFKNHSATKVEGQVQIPILEVKFEMPRFAGASVEPPADTFGGEPGYVEGQVLTETKSLTAGDSEDDSE